MKRFFIAGLFIAIASSAHAITGNDLENYLGQENLRLGAVAYISGYMDGEILAGISVMAESGSYEAFAKIKPALLCFPEGATPSQVGEIFKKYIAANPEKRHLDASILIRNSLRPIWACK